MSVAWYLDEALFQIVSLCLCHKQLLRIFWISCMWASWISWQISFDEVVMNWTSDSNTTANYATFQKLKLISTERLIIFFLYLFDDRCIYLTNTCYFFNYKAGKQTLFSESQCSLCIQTHTTYISKSQNIL